ncbi:MAG: hypothetical protein PHO26_04150 [Dehalococcoidia bacterium]|nr:hypothetical protein [Dehalococcoidia bacterium]MDD5493185.1 hypothetical protein [Dehalococcoidia bacterium]
MAEEKLDKVILRGSFADGFCIEVSHLGDNLFLDGYCAYGRKFDRIMLTDQEALALGKFIQQHVSV